MKGARSAMPIAARIGMVWAAMAAAWAQSPLVYNRAVYNAASYIPAGLPSGAIAQGAIFTFFGANLGPTQGVSATAYPLGTSLGGIAVNIIQGSKTVSALPIYVSSSQINAIMPSNAPLGMASIQVISGNFKSNLAPVRIASSAFGIFTALGTGLGPGILQNFISQTNQPINSPTVTAQNGQVITMYGTGLGPINAADNVMPPVGSLPVKVEVFVGGVSASVAYSGRAPQFAGEDQIVFTIPQNAPSGCWVPVYVRTAAAVISNVVTIAIQPSGGTCSTDFAPDVTAAFLNGEKAGEAIEVRATTRQDVGVFTPLITTTDYHISFAYQKTPGPFPFNTVLAFPPLGTCTEYTVQGDLLGGDVMSGTFPTVMPLDLGPPFSLTGPRGSKTLNFTFPNAGRISVLGGSISTGIQTTAGLFLDPGSYTLTGSGGHDVGPFTVSFAIPTPPAWTNRDTTTLISRSQGVTVSWTGGDAGQTVAVIGYGDDLPTDSSAMFVCLARRGATSFTVPPDMFSNFPVTRPNPLQSKDVLYMLTLAGSSVENLGAGGLDVGMNLDFYLNGKTVVYQ